MAVPVGIQTQAVERQRPTAAIHSSPACSVVVLIDVEVGQEEDGAGAYCGMHRTGVGAGAVMHALRRGCLSAAVGSAGTGCSRSGAGRRRYANRRPICHAPWDFLQAPVTLSVTVVSCARSQASSRRHWFHSAAVSWMECELRSRSARACVRLGGPCAWPPPNLLGCLLRRDASVRRGMTLHTKCRTVSCLCPVTAGDKPCSGTCPCMPCPTLHRQYVHVRRVQRAGAFEAAVFTNRLPVVLD